MTDRPTAELLAELEILVAFDDQRDIAGHDYGGGQRRMELARRRRVLRDRGISEVALAVGVSDAGAAALAAAFDRVGRPRIRRIEREDYRRSTPATRRTLAVWERVAETYARSSS